MIRVRRGGLSRRGFLGSVGAGTLGAAFTRPPAAAAAPLVPAGERTPAVLLVNGREHHVRVEPQETLLHVLREALGLTGTKKGCNYGECGACTVHPRRPARECVPRLRAGRSKGAALTTVEGCSPATSTLSAVQRAFIEHDAFQCGFCTPGQVIDAHRLHRRRAHALQRRGRSANG